MQPTISNPDRTLQYYVIARKWLSDMDFFKIETAYLHRLMDDYIVRLQISIVSILLAPQLF